MMDLENLTTEKIQKLLDCQEKCVWRIIITQLMQYALPIDCPREKMARSWLRKFIEDQTDRESALL